MNQIWPIGTEIWFRTDKKCGRNGLTHGRHQNYIPPPSSGDNILEKRIDSTLYWCTERCLTNSTQKQLQLLRPLNNLENKKTTNLIYWTNGKCHNSHAQHSFRCSINETAHHINLVLLIIWSTNNGKIVYSDGFYSMAMITLDMIISRKTGQFYFNTNLNKKNTLSGKIISPQFWQGDIF